MGIKLQLNLAVRDNYVFFDPVAPLHLNLSQPYGEAPRLTDSIIRGVAGKTLIDLNGVIDVKGRRLKEVVNPAEAEVKKQAELEAKRLQEEADQKAKEEAERLAKEEEQRKADEEAQRLTDEEEQRKAEEEAQRMIDEATKVANSNPVDGANEGTGTPDKVDAVPTVEPVVVEKKETKPKGSNKSQNKAE